MDNDTVRPNAPGPRAGPRCELQGGATAGPRLAAWATPAGSGPITIGTVQKT